MCQVSLLCHILAVSVWTGGAVRLISYLPSERDGVCVGGGWYMEEEEVDGIGDDGGRSV